MKTLLINEECRIMHKNDDFGFWCFVGTNEDYLKFQDILGRKEYFLVPRKPDTLLPANDWQFYNKRLTT